MNSPGDISDLHATIAILRERLLAARGPDGYWQGRLSSSALSTATAVFALAVVDRDKDSALVARGLQWLCANQNDDGGWGDTVQSPSNLSTTMLCYSALAVSDGGYRTAAEAEGLACSVSVSASSPPRRASVLARLKTSCEDARPTKRTPYGVTTNEFDVATAGNPQWTHAVRKAESWLRRRVGSLEPQALARAVEQQYGKDRTFSVPILTMCALAGRLGTSESAWRLVRPLPFELAVLPHRLYKWLRLPVVSYALPALIAIGQARYAHRKPRNPLARIVRHLSRERSLDVLTKLQPENGGFLEAAPLTSFVVMSLAASGQREHAVVSKGVKFLAASMREDGSWPIDTNLATWVTTLSINALVSCGEVVDPIRARLIGWLLACQHRDVHPYTHAEPGGWAWSNLPGAVPDADDTAGALLALHELAAGAIRHASGGSVKAEGLGGGLENVAQPPPAGSTPEGGGATCATRAAATPYNSHDEAVSAGVAWLLGLQNRDGGIPTFCRGWTKLPFDKSSPDITAHAVGAMGAWLHRLPASLRNRTEEAMRRALQYLEDAQQQDGSWVPLWFGNQHALRQENPVYGTSRALTHLARVPEPYASRTADMRDRAVRWLLAAQNARGGWNSAGATVSSVEETALAVDALAMTLLQSGIERPRATLRAVRRGAEWLIRHTEQGRFTPASPIGLYFARLWYFEELYPLIFTLSALNKASRCL